MAKLIDAVLADINEFLQNELKCKRVSSYYSECIDDEHYRYLIYCNESLGNKRILCREMRETIMYSLNTHARGDTSAIITAWEHIDYSVAEVGDDSVKYWMEHNYNITQYFRYGVGDHPTV